MGKRRNGVILYLPDDRLHLRCGTVHLKACAAIHCNEAGNYLTGTVIAGPLRVIGKRILVGTDDFENAHISIAR